MPEYDQDLVGWAHEQAALLRAGRLDEIDTEHIAGAELCRSDRQNT